MANNWTGVGSQAGQSYLDQLLANQTAKKKTASTTQPNNYFAKITSTQPIQPVNTNTLGTRRIDEMQQNIKEEEAKQNPTAPTPPPAIEPQVLYISDDPSSPYYYETLGVDQSYVGLPYQMGYWDENGPEGGNWTMIRDLLPVAQQLHELSNMPIPEGPQLTDITQTGAMQGIQDLASLLTNPDTTAADYQAGLAQFEQMMGMNPGDYSNTMANMTNQLDQGVMAQQGLSQDYQNQYGRQTQLELQQMRGDYQMMLEAMGAGGRSVAAYQQMDQIALSLSSYQMQRDMELMNKDLATRQTEYDALNDRWKSMYNMGQMTAQQYMDNIRQNRTDALTAYAQQLSTYISQNQLMLEQYQTDLQATQLHASTVYQSIMADLGVSESLMNQLNEQYEMYMAPYYAELEQYAVQVQAQQNQQALDQQNTSNFINGFAIVGMILLSPLGTVICTELKRQGLLSSKVLEADELFGKQIRKLRPDIYKGYLRFAKPIVRWMKKSKLITKIVSWFAIPWAESMAYIMGYKLKDNKFGRVIMWIGIRLCEFLGRDR
jgi:hypothetical protein